MKFDFAAFAAELQKLGADLPATLASLQAFLSKGLSPAATAFLQAHFPSLAALDAKAMADAKVVVDFLAEWEPKVMPYLILGLTALAKLWPTAVAAPPA